ncbi:MAG: pyruvate formate lyase family protein [Opitutaceae bacterium]|jgi:pyruvate-formate lyase
MNTIADASVSTPTPAGLADPFAAEFLFDAAWTEHANSHPAIREAACLAAQFPACLSPIDPADLLAGRYYATPGVGKPVREHRNHRHPWKALKYRMPALGFAALRPGWGTSPIYFFDERLLRRKIEEANPDADTLARLELLIERWRAKEPMALCRAAMPADMAAALPFDDLDSDATAHPAYPLIRFTGPMMDFDTLVKDGLPGLRRRLADRLLHSSRDGDEASLLTAMSRALDVLAGVCRFYAQQARALAEAGGYLAVNHLQLAFALERLPDHAPDSLLEAMQLVLLYATVATAYSFGRMDEYFGDLLAADLDSGRLTEAESLALIESFWQIVADCGAPFDNRIIIGGRGRRNAANADRFARLAIEATRQVQEPLPQLSLRFDSVSSPDLYQRAMKSIGEGRTFPILYNDDVNIAAVEEAMGVSASDAAQYVPYGCGEYVIYRKSFGTPSGIINLTKTLECVLRNGEEKLGGRKAGLQLGRLEDFRTFDELWQAYAANVEYWLGHLAAQQKWEYDWAGREAGWLFFSMLYEDCIARGRNLFAGGVRHLGGTMESYGQINAADSLTAIKRLVFDERKISGATLMQALDADFVGAEDIRRLLLAAPKYGNDDPVADDMQVRVHEHVCRTTRDLARQVGLDSYLVVIINNLMNTVLGRHCLASPDGRKRGTPLANANNPAPGMDRSGVTAFLNSLVKLDPSIHASSVQNMKFSREMFSRELRPKLDALLDTYWRKGGTQAMINVLNRRDLESALREPEKYANLMVRVGGFSARFVDLAPDVQQEILARTLY